MFMRLRKEKEHVWYEYLMAFRAGAYQFPQEIEDDGEFGAEGAAARAAAVAAQRGMLSMPPETNTVGGNRRVFTDRLKFQTATEPIHRVYMLPWTATQFPRASRSLRVPPTFYWVSDGELGYRKVLGRPTVFGRPVSATALEVMRALPMKLQFAHHPPVALYASVPSNKGVSITNTDWPPLPSLSSRLFAGGDGGAPPVELPHGSLVPWRLLPTDGSRNEVQPGHDILRVLVFPVPATPGVVCPPETSLPDAFKFWTVTDASRAVVDCRLVGRDRDGPRRGGWGPV